MSTLKPFTFDRSESIQSQLNPDRQKYILGIDVGGTAIKPQLFKLVDNELVEVKYKPFEEFIASKKGAREHAAQMGEIIVEAVKFAISENGVLAFVGVGAPGRFDALGRVKPFTNTNFEKPGLTEFNNLNMQKAYITALREVFSHGVDATYAPKVENLKDSEKVSFGKDQAFIRQLNKNLAYLIQQKNIEVQNDAFAMEDGMLNSVANGRIQDLVDQSGKPFGADDLKNIQIGYIGFGTGIGNAFKRFCHCSSKFITDGHASKLWIDAPEEDIKRVEAARDSWNAHHTKPEEHINIIVDKAHSRIRAEDLLRTPILSGLAGIDSASRFDMHNPKHKEAMAFAGVYLARLIAKIQSGQNDDVNGAEQGWSEKDKAEAAKTSAYLLGGGIFERKDIADAIMKSATAELKNLGVEHSSDGIPLRLIAYSHPNPAKEAAALLALDMLKQRDQGLGLQ